MKETRTISEETTDYLEISKNSKGDLQWAIKIYGDTSTKDGLDELVRRVEALKHHAIALTKPSTEEK